MATMMAVTIGPLAAREIKDHLQAEMDGGHYCDDKFEEPVNTLFTRLDEIFHSGCMAEVVVTSPEMSQMLTDAAEEIDNAAALYEEAGDDYWAGVHRGTEGQVRRFIDAWRAA